MQAEIVGVSFCVEPGHAAYVPLAHRYAGAPEQLDRTAVLARLKPLLEDAGRGKLGHHLKYDAHVLRNHGIEMRGMRYDSMLESYVLNSTATRHDLDSVARLYLGVETIHYEDVAGKGAKQIPFDQVPVERAAEYSAEDSDVSLRLHRTLWAQIERLPRVRTLYEEIEQPLVPVLLDMEHLGVLIDTAMLRKQGHEISKSLLTLEQTVHTIAGATFNLDSPKQLQEVLFGKLGLPVKRKTATGQPSTAEDVLEELAGEFELPRLILEYRGLAKLKSTYTDKLPGQVDPRTGRVHTSYHQAVAATGRLSSTDPNLQNIPVRTPEGRRIRQAFIAPPGHVLMAADYSQIELRIMAHLSGDESLLRAFAEDRDIHQATAAEVFGLAPADVTPDQRRAAKAINFGLIYGMSAFGLARQLGIDRGAAQQYVDLYFERYPGREALHGRHPRHGPGTGVRRDGVRPAPLPAGHPRAQPGAPAVRRAQCDQRAHAGHGRRHHQAGHDRGARLARGQAGAGAAGHAGARRAGARGARGRRRGSRARAAGADDGGGRSAGAAQGGRRSGPSVGRRALARIRCL